MATDHHGVLDFAFRGRWDVLNDAFGSRIRQSDALHTRGLTADERLAIVDDLLATVRAVHDARGTWEAVEERAWHAALDERHRLIGAFHRLDEVRRGHATPADAD